MNELPWFRFFPSDWLGGTRGMTAAETGVYINLLAMMYELGAPLPEESAKLARLCGASNSMFKRILEALISDKKIVRVDGGLWNGRVEKEQVYRSEKSAVGKDNAEKRWRKNKQKQEQADATAMQLQCNGNANQKPEARSQKEGSSGSSENVTNVVPADAGSTTSDDRYAFRAKTIRLTGRDLEKWRTAFPHLSLEGELWALDEWAGQQKNWFVAVSSALAKKERTAMDRISLAKLAQEAGPSRRLKPDARI